MSILLNRDSSSNCSKFVMFWQKLSLFSDKGMSQHFETLRSLHELSDEYMVPEVSKAVRDEVHSMSKALKNRTNNTTNHYIVRLLCLADSFKYERSINICARNLVSRMFNYCKFKKLIKGEEMRSKTKNKLKGMMMKKIIGETEINMNNQLDKERLKYIEESVKNSSSGLKCWFPSVTIDSSVKNALHELWSMANELND